MGSFDVLNLKNSLAAPHFLEASAGTGKTFAIEHIVVRLLLDEQVNLRSDEILLVTFTRAATRELKSRLRHNIQKALEGLVEKTSLFPYLEEIAQDLEKRSRVIKRLQEALFSFDQMQIFTIHGFCHQMLSLYPFDAGIRLHKGNIEESSHKEVMREQIIDCLRTDLTKELFHKHQIHQMLKHARYDLEYMVSKILSLIEQGGEFPKIDFYQESLEKFTEAIGELKKSSFKRKKSS
jgi:exodeoxyribonuclease V beta subunit